MPEKVTLRYCKDCREQTIHISKKEYNESDNVSRVTHRCLTCGEVTTKFIVHEKQQVYTPKNTTCAYCDKTILGKGYVVDDTMGMSGMKYNFCDRVCANEYKNKYM